MVLESPGDALFGQLKSLLLDLSRMDIAEFELEYRDIRIVVRKNGNGARKLLPAPLVPAERPAPVASPSIRTVSSPLTGVFYLKPSSTAPPFVQEGDVVQEGQIVGLVEAMKVFNEIRAEWSGRVARINAKTGELVQIGQTLLELAPLA